MAAVRGGYDHVVVQIGLRTGCPRRRRHETRVVDGSVSKGSFASILASQYSR